MSVYPVEENKDEAELLRLLESFRQSLDVRELINSITDMWPDYDKYEYDSGKVDLEYTLKGIKFQFNVGRDNGVIFYSNYNGSYRSDLRLAKNNLPRYTYFVDSNLVYENEKSKYRSVINTVADYTYVKYSAQHNMLSDVNVEKYIYDSSMFFVS